MNPFQIRFGDEDLLIDIEAFFRPMFHHLENMEKRLMSAQDDFNTRMQALEASAKASADAAVAANAKTDQVLGTLADVRAQLAGAASGTSFNVQDAIARIDAVTASLDASTGTVTAETAKEDSALIPAGTPVLDADGKPIVAGDKAP